VVAPVAFNGVDVPEQIVADPLAATTGTGATFRVKVAVPVQDPDVPLTV